MGDSRCGGEIVGHPEPGELVGEAPAKCTVSFNPRVKVIAYQPDEANKGVNRRRRGQKPARTTLFATNLLQS
jgi:hypothetical protein